MGDTIIENDTPCIETLISYAEEHGSSVLSLENVPWADVPKYGVADINAQADDACFPVEDLVEKPTRDAAPSNLAITGRYVFSSEIFEHLREIEPEVGGELQLTDAIRKLSQLRGVELEGNRYDIGTIPTWLEANIQMALHHDDGEMNDAVETMIREYVDE